MNKHCIAHIAIAMICFAGFSSFGQRYPKRELRAAWIATVMNIDWPSQKGLSAQQQQEEFVQLLDTLQSIGMNAVIVQVRPVADAFQPSSYEPWSEYLSGIQGQPPQPYYDPLNFMIAQARQRGMEFHAWFNPYRAGMKKDFAFAPDHPVRKHPEWFLEYGDKIYYDPGNPEVREFVLQSIMETVKHYDLDAVHFDDYFYPYRIANVEFPDSCSFETYRTDAFEDKGDWRRHNVDVFVEQLSRRIKAEKPHVKFGISPFGVWRNIDKDSTGSQTQAGQTNYDDLYADVLKWLREGWIDYVVPQIYWHIGFKVADYQVLVDWWSKHTYGKHLYIGQGAYRLGGKGWEDPLELVHQIDLNHTFASVNGSMYFSAKTFLANKNYINIMMRGIYPYKALVPVMDWISGHPPSPPEIQSMSGNPEEGITLAWKDVIPFSSAYYVVYRFSKDEPVNIEDATAIQAIVQRRPYAIQSWTDLHIKKRRGYTYVVTAVDRLHNESGVSKTVVIKTRGTRKRVHFDNF